MHDTGLYMRGQRLCMRVSIFLLMFACAAVDLTAQYTGPSILSRGGNLPGRRGRAPVDLTFYAGVRGTADSGLRAPVLDESGELRPVSSMGVSTEAGLYGGKNWSRSSFGVDYRGDYRRLFSESPSARRFNGWNQVVSLNYQHRLARRVFFQVSQNGGTTNRAFGGFMAPAFSQLGRTGIPLNELFDVRTDFLQSAASISWQRSARTAYTAGANAFFIKRNFLNLVNSQGYSFNLTPTYRKSRRLTLQSTYQFMRFEFPRLFAASNIHSMSGGFQYVATQEWTFDVNAGLYLLRNRGTEQVQLSPEVSEILGRPVGLATFVRNTTAPLFNIQATRSEDRGSLRISAAQIVIPGNGVFLTATSRTLNAGYSYAGTRRISLGLSGGYTQYQSKSLNLRNFQLWQVGTGMSYKISAGLNFTSQLDYRSFSTRSATQRAREGFALTLGLAYTTSRLPLSIW